MARKKRIEIKFRQRKKRRKRRKELLKEGKNPDDYFYNGICVEKPIKQ